MQRAWLPSRAVGGCCWDGHRATPTSSPLPGRPPASLLRPHDMPRHRNRELVERLPVGPAERQVGNEVLIDGNAPEQLALWRDDVNARLDIQSLTGVSAREVDAGRHPEVA